MVQFCLSCFALRVWQLLPCSRGERLGVEQMPSQLAFGTGAGWAGRVGAVALSLNLSSMIHFQSRCQRLNLTL